MFVWARGGSFGRADVRGWLTRERIVLYSCAIIVLYAVFFGAWARVTHGFTTTGIARPGTDFSVFWVASHLMLDGSPLQAYDYSAFSRIHSAWLPGFANGGFLPWLYPPTFFLVIAPLALFSFPVAYCLFVGLSSWVFTVGILRVSGFAHALRGLRIGRLIVATSPFVFVAAVLGQNSILTAALAALAVYWIDRNPVRAGLCIGLLIIKPQMALLFPFVLVAARAWRVIAAAAISAITVLSLSVLICGIQSVPLFLASANLARDLILAHGYQFWLVSPTSFAAFRLGDFPLIPAYIAHACVGILAALAACHVWKTTSDPRLRGAILAVATLICNPYLWFYELAWLGIAVASLVAIGLEGRWLRGEQEVLVLAWLLPLIEMFNRVTKLPQIGPIVLLLVLLVILRRARDSAEDNS